MMRVSCLGICHLLTRALSYASSRFTLLTLLPGYHCGLLCNKNQPQTRNRTIRFLLLVPHPILLLSIPFVFLFLCPPQSPQHSNCALSYRLTGLFGLEPGPALCLI